MYLVIYFSLTEALFGTGPFLAQNPYSTGNLDKYNNGYKEIVQTSNPRACPELLLVVSTTLMCSPIFLTALECLPHTD